MNAERLLNPLREFIHTEASSGIILLGATCVALLWANSAWGDSYNDLWQAELTIGFEQYGLSKSLLHWINDGLMAVFFFVVGLEIKREVLVGELASMRQAMLPVTAAFGGALIPAIIFLLFNAGTATSGGWGIPMATDIAFALGVLALLGSRVPTALKIFVTALAIVDDILAVLVIALFYTETVNWNYLLLGGGLFLALVAANRAHIARPFVYGLLGFGLWLAFLNSGVHATVAGVLLAMTIPARTRINAEEFVARGQASLDRFSAAGRLGSDVLTNKGHQAALSDLNAITERVESPMQHLEHAIHPWVAFAVVPLFALANAGVTLDENLTDALTSSLGLGVVFGLVIGKQLGIVSFAWLAIRLGLTERPPGVRWRHIYGAGWLAGIGFTMSLFVTDLAFNDPTFLSTAKLGVLVASVISGAAGWLILRRASH